ncbi:MAG: DUF4388 domain-containing protein [Gemmatimonadota bacterium]|jgi:Flp pilus assembly protein TadD|nr:DUF4388 domain-containing protein [Gemmatimonadota bacterium]
MAIKGSLREASLADVLQLLALGRKAGCLSVSDRGSFGRIFFDDGMITLAAIINHPDRLGDLLVRNGVITREQQLTATTQASLPDSPSFGEILLNRRDLTRPTLERFVRLQIEEVVYHLFTWHQGVFHFEVGERPARGEVTVFVNSEGLLLEGARRVDEWTQIEKQLSPGMVFAVDEERSGSRAGELSDALRRILPLVDGDRSAHEVVEESGLLEFDGYKAIFDLLRIGVLRNTGRMRVFQREESTTPSGEGEHRNLGLAFFRASMLEDAEREFLRLLEKDPGNSEARFFLGTIAIRRKDPRAAVRHFMRLIEAGEGKASSFHNLALALELSDRLDDAMVLVDQALRDFPRNRDLLLARAILLVRRGDPASARHAFVAFDNARDSEAETPEPAAYYVYSIVALGGTGHLVDAISRAKEGVLHYPRHPALLVNAAAAHERGGDTGTAESLYARAAEEAPDLVQARRGLADSLYLRGAFDQAAMIYQRLARDVDPVPPEIFFKLGNIAYKRGDRRAALAWWRETVDADPSHSMARTNLELVEGTLDTIRA